MSKVGFIYDIQYILSLMLLKLEALVSRKYTASHFIHTSFFFVLFCFLQNQDVKLYTTHDLLLQIMGSKLWPVIVKSRTSG